MSAITSVVLSVLPNMFGYLKKKTDDHKGVSLAAVAGGFGLINSPDLMNAIGDAIHAIELTVRAWGG
jgi:hypothetical protein